MPGAYTQDFRRGGGARGGEGARGGGGGERRGGGDPPKKLYKPNKRATGLKPRTCAHQGSMFRP